VSNGSLGRPVAGMFDTLMANSLNRKDASVCWRFSPVCTFCSMYVMLNYTVTAAG
jgi:hypothetical protein